MRLWESRTPPGFYFKGGRGPQGPRPPSLFYEMPSKKGLLSDSLRLAIAGLALSFSDSHSFAADAVFCFFDRLRPVARANHIHP